MKTASHATTYPYRVSLIKRITNEGISNSHRYDASVKSGPQNVACLRKACLSPNQIDELREENSRVVSYQNKVVHSVSIEKIRI